MNIPNKLYFNVISFNVENLTTSQLKMLSGALVSGMVVSVESLFSEPGVRTDAGGRN
jgi:hypothetical protein